MKHYSTMSNGVTTVRVPTAQKAYYEGIGYAVKRERKKANKPNKTTAPDTEKQD